MKALIIGGAGFVGAYLMRYLKEELHMEVTVTKMPQEQIEAENVKVCDLDILKKDDITGLFKAEQPDWIFHLAAQSSVSVSWKNPALTIDVNVKGGSNVLEAFRESGIKARMLLIGSGEEYGHILPEETPIKENNCSRPGNIYAATKACQNMLGKIYADAYGLDVMMVRAFNHIGPNQTPMFVVADFCQQAAEIEAGKREAVMRVGKSECQERFYGCQRCDPCLCIDYGAWKGRRDIQCRKWTCCFHSADFRYDHLIIQSRYQGRGRPGKIKTGRCADHRGRHPEAGGVYRLETGDSIRTYDRRDIRLLA